MIDTRFAVAAPPRVYEGDRPMTDVPVAAQDQDSRYRGPGLATLDHPRECRSLGSRDGFNREAGPEHLLLKTVSRFVGADGSH